jgi:hypothetical protein
LDNDADDDEEGRSRLGKKNESASAALPPAQYNASAKQPASKHEQTDRLAPLPSSNRKRGSSYLDQLLAERAMKRQKKKNKDKPISN